MFCMFLVGNFIGSLVVKEFRKSIRFDRVTADNTWDVFFETQCIFKHVRHQQMDISDSYQMHLSSQQTQTLRQSYAVSLVVRSVSVLMEWWQWCGVCDWADVSQALTAMWTQHRIHHKATSPSSLVLSLHHRWCEMKLSSAGWCHARSCAFWGYCSE